VRLFKQISLDGEDDCDLIFSNENESLESTENEDESSSDEIPTISDVNKEIQEMKNELRKLSVEDKSFCKSEDEIVENASGIEGVDDAKLIEEEEHEIDEINNTLKINLGSSELPRISCANHKLNLCIRTAIAKHKPLNINIRILNSYVNRVKRTIRLNEIFVNAKCRLRLENSTRWGSTFLMLERLKKANKKGVFDNFEVSNKLPVSIDFINSYLKILKSAYLVNVYFQRDSSTIAEVIPAVLKLINDWEAIIKKDNVSSSCKTFCKLLIEELKRRFDYELNSEIYQVL
jgi:hypothetical protein